jgi:hypothetical protein
MARPYPGEAPKSSRPASGGPGPNREQNQAIRKPISRLFDTPPPKEGPDMAELAIAAFFLIALAFAAGMIWLTVRNHQQAIVVALTGTAQVRATPHRRPALEQRRRPAAA